MRSLGQTSVVPWAPLMAGALALGCAEDAGYLNAALEQAPSQAAQGLVAQFALEAAAVSRLLSLSQMLLLFVVVALAFAATRLVHGAVHAAWRLGLDGARQLASVRSIANALIVGGAGYVVLGRFLSAAPIITLVVLALSVSASLLVFAGPIQNVWVGLGMTMRRRVREGDRVIVGEHAGIVREIGLTRLHLRCADGATVLVPNRMLLREAIRVERAKNTVPVAVRLALAEQLTPALLDHLRRAALLSPYRVARSPVEVTADGDGHMRVVVHVWSERAIHEGRSHLTGALEAVLEQHRAKQASDDPSRGGTGGSQRPSP